MCLCLECLLVPVIVSHRCYRLSPEESFRFFIGNTTTVGPARASLTFCPPSNQSPAAKKSANSGVSLPPGGSSSLGLGCTRVKLTSRSRTTSALCCFFSKARLFYNSCFPLHFLCCGQILGEDHTVVSPTPRRFSD